jgi:hypothetical protein
MPDDEEFGINLNNISLSQPRNRCSSPGLLGYYISWHIVGLSFKNEKGRRANSGFELLEYNNTLHEENRYGIHICCKTIKNYIDNFSLDGFEQSQIESYKEYCTYLTLIYVIAHEWGHYRSELLSFQLKNLIESVTGERNQISDLTPLYLSYFIYKKQFPNTNFEEVFAEWSSLKMGIFNFHNKKPSFANSISNWPIVEATVKYMLTQVISRPNRIKPYSDIRFWVDFNRITSNEIMERISENKKSLNRSVNDNVRIIDIKSLKNGKLIDLLMHNQMQFTSQYKNNGIVKSDTLAYPYNPDSSFYHLGDDECLEIEPGGNSNRFLHLNNLTSSQAVDNPILNKVISNLKEDGYDYAGLPIRTFPEILPINNVYFH